MSAVRIFTPRVIKCTEQLLNPELEVDELLQVNKLINTHMKKLLEGSGHAEKPTVHRLDMGDSDTEHKRHDFDYDVEQKHYEADTEGEEEYQNKYEGENNQTLLQVEERLDRVNTSDPTEYVELLLRNLDIMRGKVEASSTDKPVSLFYEAFPDKESADSTRKEVRDILGEKQKYTLLPPLFTEFMMPVDHRSSNFFEGKLWVIFTATGVGLPVILRRDMGHLDDPRMREALETLYLDTKSEQEFLN